MPRISRRWTLVALVLGALVLRLGLMVALEAHVIEDDWDFGYETGRIAKSLATGEGFSSPFGTPSGPTAWMMPAYPFLLALVFKLVGVYSPTSAVLILAFNCLISALTCIPVFLLADRVFGRATALLAGALFALYPSSIWHAITTIWDTSLFAFCAVWLLYLFYRLQDRPGLGTLVLYGTAVGCVAWINPLILAFLPFVVVWILWQRDRPVAWRLSGIAVLSLAVALLVSPWIARNYLTFDRLFLRSNLGLELRLGNSDGAWADFLEGFHTTAFFHGHPSLSPEELDRYVSQGEVHYMEEALRDALAFITANPGKSARMSLKRVGFYWFGELGKANEWSGNLGISISLSALKKLFYLLPLAPMLLGLVLAMRSRLEVAPLVGYLMLLPLPYYLTHVSSRYRFPIEPCLVILASYGLWWTMDRVVRGRRAASKGVE